MLKRLMWVAVLVSGCGSAVPAYAQSGVEQLRVPKGTTERWNGAAGTVWAECILKAHRLDDTLFLDSLETAAVEMVGNTFVPSCANEAMGYAQPNTNDAECGLRQTELDAWLASDELMRVVACGGVKSRVYIQTPKSHPPARSNSRTS